MYSNRSSHYDLDDDEDNILDNYDYREKLLRHNGMGGFSDTGNNKHLAFQYRFLENRDDYPMDTGNNNVIGGMDRNDMTEILQQNFAQRFANVNDDSALQDDDPDGWDDPIDNTRVDTGPKIIPKNLIFDSAKYIYKTIINKEADYTDSFKDNQVRNNKRVLLQKLQDYGPVYTWDDLNDSLISDENITIDEFKKFVSTTIQDTTTKLKVPKNNKLWLLLSILGPLDTDNIKLVDQMTDYYDTSLLNPSFNILGQSLTESPNIYGKPTIVSNNQEVPTDNIPIQEGVNTFVQLSPSQPNRIKQIISKYPKSEQFDVQDFQKISISKKHEILTDFVRKFIEDSLSYGTIGEEQYYDIDRKINKKPAIINTTIKKIKTNEDLEKVFNKDYVNLGRPSKNPKPKPQPTPLPSDSMLPPPRAISSSSAAAEEAAKIADGDDNVMELAQAIDNSKATQLIEQNPLFEELSISKPQVSERFLENRDFQKPEISQAEQEELDAIANALFSFENMIDENNNRVVEPLTNAEMERINTVTDKINNGDIKLSESATNKLSEAINTNNLNNMKAILNDKGETDSNMKIIQKFIIPPAPPLLDNIRDVHSKSKGKSKGKAEKAKLKNEQFKKNQALLDSLLTPIFTNKMHTNKHNTTIDTFMISPYGNSETVPGIPTPPNSKPGSKIPPPPPLPRDTTIVNNTIALNNQAALLNNSGIAQPPVIANSTTLIIIKLLQPYVSGDKLSAIKLGAAQSILSTGRYSGDELTAIDNYLRRLIQSLLVKYSGKTSPSAVYKKEYLESMLNVLNNKTNPQGTSQLFKHSTYIKPTKFSTVTKSNSTNDYLKRIELNTRKVKVVRDNSQKTKVTKKTTPRTKKISTRAPSKNIKLQQARNVRIKAAYEKLKALRQNNPEIKPYQQDNTTVATMTQ